jgi:hypothetical protein
MARLQFVNLLRVALPLAIQAADACEQDKTFPD